MGKSKKQENKQLLLPIIAIVIAIVCAVLLGKLYLDLGEQEKEISRLRNRVTKIEARLKSQNAGAGKF